MVGARGYVFLNKKVVGASVTWVFNYKMIHERVTAVSLLLHSGKIRPKVKFGTQTLIIHLFSHYNIKNT